jgi:hypothetical protein
MTFRSDSNARVGVTPTLATTALVLAGTGQPVLPLHTPTPDGCSCRDARCDRPGKHPRSANGLLDATTNLELVAGWWRAEPAANVGMRCDGLVVFDVDGAEGERSLAQLERDLAPLPRTRTQASGRDHSWHRIYRAPDNVAVGNSTRPLGDPPGIDLRAGPHGYIVAAPSLHASGRRYETRDNQWPALLPDEWLDVLERPPRHLPTSGVQPAAATTRYGRAALDSELERLLARAREGKRNNELNTSVFRLAQLVAGGELVQGELERAATDAGHLLGLDAHEVRVTVRSAVKAGLLQARSRA